MKITYKGPRAECIVHPFKDIKFHPYEEVEVPDALYEKIKDNPEFERVETKKQVPKEPAIKEETIGE